MFQRRVHANILVVTIFRYLNVPLKNSRSRSFQRFQSYNMVIVYFLPELIMSTFVFVEFIYYSWGEQDAKKMFCFILIYLLKHTRLWNGEFEPTIFEFMIVDVYFSHVFHLSNYCMFVFRYLWGTLLWFWRHLLLFLFVQIDTKDILFICGGAFIDLEKTISER